jgi:predicted nucleic acid-binding protein
MIIALDTGIIGMVTNPKSSPESFACTSWLKAKLAAEDAIFLPEICDYEIRRELIRANKVAGLSRLDALKKSLNYLPITTEAMLKAAEFWATARRKGKPTAPDLSLDGDMILTGQILVLAENLQKKS